jgi:hypothetical protein
VLYPQLLDGDFARLPRALREFHSTPGGGRASGTAAVRRENELLARLAGFPQSGENIPLELQVVAGENKEVWTRRFGGTVLRTIQRRKDNLLLETFGPVRMLFRLFADETGMHFECRRVCLWAIPLPLRVEARARGDESSWEVEVTIRRIGSYRASLVPVR